MAEELERKLREMIAALRGDWRGRTLQAASGPPPLTASTEKLSELLRPVPVAERRILFCGKVESVLQAFNDPKTALVKSIGDKQLARMAEQAEGFSRHARALGHHFLLSQVADSELRADIDAAIVANAELVARLTALISGACENSLRSLLEANGNQLRNQFTFACAVACLKVYGNVSVAHLRTLLGLKHLGYLAIQDAAYRRSPDGQADLKRMGRQIDLALSTVRRQASKDHPPIERILALFEVNPALGRRPERRRPRPTGSGPEDQTFPSTDGSSDW